MTVSKQAVLSEVIARKNIATNANKVSLSADFPAQNDFVQDPSRYIAAQCSRRAGKTNGLALRFFRTMETHPKSQCLYLGLTRQSSKEILWNVLQEMNDKFQLGCSFVESSLTMRHPNGASLVLFGADAKNLARRLKGRKYAGVGIDESQDFTSVIQSLVEDVLTPSISDYVDGWLAVTGTPGPVPQGYFFDVTQGGKYGFSQHRWTMLENPHMPDPKAFLDDLMQRREWKEDNPTLLREYRNKWVLDTNSLWIQYTESENHFDTLPTGHQWNYILGVDFGFNDSDALAVLAWSETSKVTYLVEELVTPKQGITELIEQVKFMQDKYKVHKTVADEGGLGKKMAEEMRRRYGISMQAADKARKQENVELLNDSMRLGTFKAHKKSRFATDSYLIQIDWDKTTPNRIVVKKKPHSDIIDAVLYAYKESYAHTFEPPKPEGPKWGTPEWAKAQSNEMFEAELEGHMAEQEHSKWLKGEF